MRWAAPCRGSPPQSGEGRTGGGTREASAIAYAGQVNLSLPTPLRSRAGALATSLAVAAVLVAAPAPQALSAPGDALVDTVTATPSTVTLTRKQTRTISVAFHLVVPGGQQVRAGSLPAIVDRGDAVDFPRTALTRLSGTNANGVWQAELTAGSMMNGVHPLAVEVCPVGRDCVSNGPLRVTLGASGVVTVNGSDWPVLGRVAQSPRRLPAGDATGAKAVGRVVYSATRDPARGVDVMLRKSPEGSDTVVDRTNRKGAFTAPWPWPNGGKGTASLRLQLPDVPSVTFDRHHLGFPATSFRVRVRHAPAVASVDRRYRVKGLVTPGSPVKRLGPIKLQELRNGRWATVDRSRLRAVTEAGSATRRAAFTLTTSIGSVGRHTMRVLKPSAMCRGAGPCTITKGSSSRFGVVAGNRAYFVEKKLASLSVPVGSVDGVVDSRTRQALCAWRDMSGDKPTRRGVTRRVANSILGAHRLPRPNRSDGLYVNKTCQVLLQVVDHRFRRVVWASSGQPAYETPNGTGAIFRKLDGPVESTFYPGAFMYNPMFFLPSRPAIALHGSATNSLVLPYPASHGCVRVWRPDIVEIYHESPLGTKVKVYGHY